LGCQETPEVQMAPLKGDLPVPKYLEATEISIEDNLLN
jgi:hypothetical protein